MVLRVSFGWGLATVGLLCALLVPACPAAAFAAPFGGDPRSGWLAGGARGASTRPSVLCPQLFCPGLQNRHAPLVRMSVRGGSTLPPDVVARNERRNGERREQNLEIARRVAAGELRPVVVSFSARIRDTLRLPKRYKHTRIFVEQEDLTSMERLRAALERDIPRPLAKLPRDAYSIGARPVSAYDSDSDAESSAPAGEGGDDSDGKTPSELAEAASAFPEESSDVEDGMDDLVLLDSDAALREAYARSQEARSSGIGKLRLVLQDTEGFTRYLEHLRGYKMEADGALPGGVSPKDSDAWVMVSFYKLTTYPDPADLCTRLMEAWAPLGILGRVYVAPEGINAQVSVPSEVLPLFEATVAANKDFEGVFLNKDEPVSFDTQPFNKLQIKPRKQVLADGLDTPLKWENNGKHLSPAEWHAKLQVKLGEKPPVLLDVRNTYESQVGLFKNAKALDTTTFRDTWAALEKALEGVDKDTPILSYCTGGIRCEKANAFIIQEMGFTDVSALKGGIVNYGRYSAANNLTSIFQGVNHVFDQRLGQRMSDEVLATCITCGGPSDVQTDCASTHCPRPFAKRRFVQCPECAVNLQGCCAPECRNENRCREGRDALFSQAEHLRVLLRRARKEEKGRADGPVRLAEADAQVVAVEAKLDAEEAQLKVLHATAVVAVAENVRAEDAALKGESGAAATMEERYAKMDSRNHLGEEAGLHAMYAEQLSSPEPPHLAEVRERTSAALPGRAHMLSSAVQGEMLAMLVALSSANRVLEIGCFTGYATLAMAAALPEGGEVLTLERDPEVAQIARDNFAAAPLTMTGKIWLVEGEAMEELARLGEEGASFDLVFLDANKKQYSNYLAALLDRGLLKVGGLLVVDNVLWKGMVPQLYTSLPEERVERNRQRQRAGVMSLVEADKYAEAMHSFNVAARDDPRTQVVLLPVRDGLSLIRRVK